MMNNFLASSFVQGLVWHSLILPGISTLIVCLILIAYERTTHRQIIRILWATPLLIGLLIGYFAVYRDWSLLPHTVLGWLPILAVATVLFCGLTDYLRRFRLLSSALLVACASVVMLKPIMNQMTLSSALVEWVSVAILWWLLWTGATNDKGDQRGAAVSQIVFSVGLAAAGPLSQSILIGQLATVLAASWVVIIVISWLRPSVSFSATIINLSTLVLGILIIELWYYASAPLKVVLPFLIASALSVATQRFYYRMPISRPFMSTLIPAAITALPVIFGIIFAWQAYTASGGAY